MVVDLEGTLVDLEVAGVAWEIIAGISGGHGRGFVTGFYSDGYFGGYYDNAPAYDDSLIYRDPYYGYAFSGRIHLRLWRAWLGSARRTQAWRTPVGEVSSCN